MRTMKNSRSQIVSVRLTEEEYAAVSQWAEDRHFTVSEYLRACVSGREFPVRRKFTALVAGGTTVMVDDRATGSRNLSFPYLSVECTTTYPAQ
jgi:hypothetical protein